MGGVKKKWEGERRDDIFMVRPSRLIFDPLYNVREDFGDMIAFTNEIRAQGIKQPLTGYRQGNFIVVKSGHRRTTAAKNIEKEGKEFWVPIVIEKGGYNPERRVIDLWTDNGGLPLSPLEQSKVLGRLIDFGWSEERIIEQSGKSDVYIRRLKLLLAAPEKAIQLIRKRVATGTFVMDLMAEGRIDELLQKAEKNEMETQKKDELFPVPEPIAPLQKITKSDLKPNSWRLFKKWALNIEEEKLSDGKLEAWKLMKKMLAGEATEKDFKKFFR